MEQMNNYFTFNKDVVLVKGYNRGVIHNLNDGSIYSINKEAKEKLSRLLRGDKIDYRDNEFVEYLNVLVQNKLGYFNDEGIVSGDYDYYKRDRYKMDTVWFQLRKACNLKCIHCYLDANYNSDIDLEILKVYEWKKVIDELSLFPPSNIILIGGEPMMYEGINDVIRYIVKKLQHTRVGLYSNLTYINEEFIELIKSNGISVITSLYSYRREIHEEITRVKGSFNKTVNNIKLLNKLGIDVTANIVAMKKNIADIDKTKSFIESITDKKAKVDYVRNIGDSKETIMIENRTKRKEVKIYKKDFIKNVSGNSCLQGKMNITCDGYVSPCIMSERFIDNKYNIKNNSLKEIIDKYLMERFWKISRDYIKVCKDCEYRYTCKDCRAVEGSVEDLYQKCNCNYNPYGE